MIKVFTISFLVYVLFRLIRGNKKIEKNTTSDHQEDTEFTDYEEID